MKKTIFPILALLALLLTACSDSSNQDLYPFSENGKWGYINQDGDVVIKPRYDNARAFVGDYAAVLLDTIMLTSEYGDYDWDRSLWCIIDKNGRLQLKDVGTPLYGNFRITADGYVIGCHGRWRGDAECMDLINIKDGMRPLPKLYMEDCDEIRFETMEILQKGGMLAYHDIIKGLWGFMDLDGNIIEPKYSKIFGVQNGIASVQDNESGKYYLIDKSGNRTTKQEYESIVFHLGHNLYTVRFGEKYAIINSKGDIVVEPKFDDMVGGFNDNGLLYVKMFVEDDLQYAFSDTIGNIVIGPYDELGFDYSEGLLLYGVGEYPEYKEGYFDKNGKTVITPQFTHSSDFHEGLAWAQKAWNGKYGYIDKTGSFVIQPSFDNAYSFQKCGLAKVKQGELYGVIDKTGKNILEPTYDDIEIYDTGMISFRKDGRNGYANAQGKIVKTYL